LLLFSIEDRIIASFQEIPGTEKAGARVILRDMTGKYAWDASVFYTEVLASSLQQQGTKSEGKFQLEKPFVAVSSTEPFSLALFFFSFLQKKKKL